MPTREPQVSLSLRGVNRILSGHPWVYRSDIRAAEGLEPGAAVQVRDERGRFLGRGWFSTASQIALRLLTREDVPIDDAFLAGRLEAAADYRGRVVENTTAYRLVYGESDGLPGLVVDRYADYFVIQTLTQAAERLKNTFVRLLEERFRPAGIVERNDPKGRQLEGLEQRTGVLAGECPPEVVVEENGVRFAYDLLRGQKTGGFLDQRENRAAVARYARGSVLDCFCYAGGFALTLGAWAEQVEAIDNAPTALAAARRNLELNGTRNVVLREANVFDVLKAYSEAGRQFDMVILDPPAFAKNKASLEPARRGYKEINLRALKLLRPGGTLVSCSCSYHVAESMLLELVAEAALDAGRQVVVMERRTQARDHPILLTMPESHYLKCMVLAISS